MLSVKNYKYKPWIEEDVETFDNYNTKVDPSWYPIFAVLVNDKRFTKIINKLRADLEKNIFPYPKLVFNAFVHTPFDKIKCVILGQDPYHGIEDEIPQAMGLSFSVPVGIRSPSSLCNIYRNLLKYKHIKQHFNHGNLESWADEGCLMLNTALTVIEGKANSHSKIWAWFTDYIIECIAKERKHVVFVLWGANALKKLSLIKESENDHKIIISSHPSGLSCNNTLQDYPAFMDCDFVGETNKYLDKNNIEKIDFKLT